MKSLAILTAVLMLAAAQLHAEEPTAAPTPAAPNFAAMEKDVLVVMCDQLWKRVQSLEAQVAQLESQRGAEAGGEAGAVATVDGDMTSVADGTWTVTIISNKKPDTSHLEAQIESEQRAIEAADKVVANAQDHLNDTLARGIYKDKSGYRHGYKTVEKTQAEAGVNSAKRARQIIDTKIANLRRQIEVEKANLNIIGTDDAGRPVKIFARGIYLNAGAALREGETYTIGGRGSVTSTGITIYLKTATAVADEIAGH